MEFGRGMKRESGEFDGLLTPGMKRSRSSEKFEIRLLIPSRAAGSIIGKGGAKIQQLRSENDANVRVPDCPGPERVMTIQTEDSPAAIKVIEQALPYMSEENDGPLEIRLLIHDSVVGGVIGRAGAKIKEIRSDSGANVRVYTTCCPQSTERCIAVQGNDEKIVAALEIIMEVIKSNEIRGEDILFDPNNFDGIYATEYGGYGSEADILGFSRGGMPSRSTPRGRGRGTIGSRGFGASNGVNFTPTSIGAFSSGMGAGMNGYGEAGFGGFGSFGNSKVMNGGGFGAMGSFGPGKDINGAGFGGNTFGGLNKFSGSTALPGAMEMVSGPVETTKVTIPNSMAGAIIGAGGTRIRQIRMESKATIEIGEPDGTTAERVISISGNEKRIQLAQFLLQQAVRENGPSPLNF